MRASYIFAALLLVAGCSSAAGAKLGPEITVPGQFGTIQAAVDVAREGATIVVSPGVYKESVRVGTRGVTIRGAQRDGVIIDGEVKRANGIVVTAPEVSVQNLTVRNHTLNGVLVTGVSENGGMGRGSNGYTRLDTQKFPPLQGFRVSYVTASNNALYGIYAFDAQHGVIEQSYASGSADSGFYVGQCKPCDIVVRGNVGERNAVGYEGTNASGRMFVLGNRFSGNRVGMTSNSDYQEAFVPQEDATFIGNLVSGNSEARSPAQADGAFGLGVGIAGGTGNLFSRNLVTGNPGAGVALGSSEDLAPLDNRFEGNVIAGNGQDVVYAASKRAPGRNNCFDRERCYEGVGDPLPKASAPGGIPFNQVAAPPPQPEMPSDPLPDKAPDAEKYEVPREDLFDDRAAVRS
ncbi:right-handed parallel beta-helix repeat-containing protein [Lentzea sp. NBC_00516]|uniref:right-handed parallel beta-helix repeat-containing protein n=1 Tax=Lentzea sp. NBC_00516 TaxID=2903582 RepID=UPI002E81915A|nr:right-handed parallel beta-helix repeat-containing protein [Lentzea sp. NBC_00516]WUD28623.1 right-handed parallel beta-helix repeat-containing protein [Lentzea sp. NBC_00516]